MDNKIIGILNFEDGKPTTFDIIRDKKYKNIDTSILKPPEELTPLEKYIIVKTLKESPVTDGYVSQKLKDENSLNDLETTFNCYIDTKDIQHLLAAEDHGLILKKYII